MAARSSERVEFELELPSNAPSVTEARARAAEVARRVGAPEADVKLAVSEAVGNAVLHAFRDREPGTVTISARVEGDRLLISVADDGSGMRPNIDSPGLGLGLSLITKLAADVRFDSDTGGTTVSMAFDAPGGMEAGA